MTNCSTRVRRAGVVLAVALTCAVSFVVGSRLARPAAYLNYQKASATIEIYVDGDLAGELQPQDGETYVFLRDLMLHTATIAPSAPPTRVSPPAVPDTI